MKRFIIPLLGLVLSSAAIADPDKTVNVINASVLNSASIEYQLCTYSSQNGNLTCGDTITADIHSRLKGNNMITVNVAADDIPNGLYNGLFIRKAQEKRFGKVVAEGNFADNCTLDHGVLILDDYGTSQIICQRGTL